MTLLGALLAVGAFVAAFQMSGIVPAARASVATSQSAFTAMRDPSLQDEEKERIAQKASLELMKKFLSLSVRGALVLLVSLLPVFAFSALGLATRADMMRVLMSWQLLVGATVVLGAGALVLARRKRS